MDMLDTTVCLHLLLTLGHFTWQATLILLLAALARAILFRRSAASRYGVLVAALLLMSACPVGTAIWIHHEAAPANAPAFAGRDVADATDATAPWSAQLSARAPGSKGRPTGALGAAAFEATGRAGEPRAAVRACAPYLAIAYLLGATCMFLRLLVAIRGGQHLRLRSFPIDHEHVTHALARQSRALGLRVAPAVARCREIVAPTVIGVLRPMILVPLSLTAQMSPRQIEMLLAHELAHIKRYDHLVNLFQRVLEAAFFFHPAVWVLSGWIRTEREQCCDDLVVRAGSLPFAYAESLVRMAELSLRQEDHSVAALALRAGGQTSQLGLRVSRLLGESQHEQLHLRHVWTLMVVVLAASALTLNLLASKAPAAETGVPASPSATPAPIAPTGRALLDRHQRSLGDRPIFGPLAKQGAATALTVDAGIQEKLESQLADRVRFHDADSALGVVMNVKTGEILAMANHDAFGPKTRDDARTDSARNPVICEAVEPGSVFKPFVMAAILENHAADRADTIDCHDGVLVMGSRTLHDAHPYRELSVDMVMSQSSNIGMALLGQRLKSEALHAKLQQFGFDKKTNIDLPGEDDGMMLPVRQWTNESAVSMSMGQEIAVTPMQLMTAFGAICNQGKLLKPRLLAVSPAEPGRQVLAPEVARNLVEMLVKTCTEGTGAECKLEHWQALGKTGTAQLAKQDKSSGYEPDAYLASFIAAAPASDPQIAVLVMTRHPRKNGYYGATVCLPAVREVLSFTLNYLGVKHDLPRR